MPEIKPLLPRHRKSDGQLGLAYSALLAIFVICMVAEPFITDRRLLRIFLDIGTALAVVAAIPAVGQSRRMLIVMLMLGIPMALSSFMSRSFAVEFMYPITMTFRTVFASFLITAIFMDIFRRRSITRDAVIGACAAYVLLCVAWGSLFTLQEWFQPGSFHMHMESSPYLDQESTEFQLNYLSIITMTSVGYGDITPLAPEARVLTSLEAILGQLYLAIVIATLVGKGVTGQASLGHPPEDGGEPS